MPACVTLPPILGTQGASGDLPKVLYCSFDVIPEASGTSARATEFLRGLTPVFNVDGLTAKTPDHSHIVRYHGARLMRVPVGSGDLPSRAQAFERAVRRQLESDEYQLVHFTDPYGGYALCELKAQQNFKVLYEVVGFPSIELKYTHPHLEGDRRFVAKLRRQELFCLMNADAVLVGSQVTAAMVESLGVSRERVFVIPPAVELSDYPAIPRAREEGAPLRTVYIGNQHSWQGLSTLLFGLSAAARTIDVRLSIVGPVNHEWRLQLDEMIKYGKLGDRVEFLDPVPHAELPKLLAAADVGLAPLEKSERNTQQGAPIMKLAHYLASGLPVIASDLPVTRELLDDEVALFHKPGDEKTLAQRLIELAEDPERRRRMGQRARALAVERLGARSAQRRLRELYAGLLGIDVPEPDEAAEATAATSDDAPTSMVTIDDPRLVQVDQHTLIQFQERSLAGIDAHTDPYVRPAGRGREPARARRIEEIASSVTDPATHIVPAPSVLVSRDATGTDPAIRAAEDSAPSVVVAREATGTDPAIHALADEPNLVAAAEPERPPPLPFDSEPEAIDVTADAEPLPPLEAASGEPEEVSEEDIEDAPPVQAHEEIGDEDIEPVEPEVEPAPVSQAAAPTTPSSGVSPEEEWFGHVLFGYAPFDVPLHRRVSTGEQPMLLPRKGKLADGSGS